MKKKLSQILSLVVCLLMVAAVSLRRDGKLLGHDFRAKQKAETSVKNDTLRMEPDGTMVINTTSLGKDISGYGGAVPLEISVDKKGIVTQVKALPNGETPEFFGRASALFNAWKGKSLKEAEATQVDAVSGATYSSKAIIANMQRGLQYADKASAKAQTSMQFDFSAKNIAGLIVALMAAIIPLFVKNRRYRIAQQVLNIVVLGFWCGTMVSYSAIIGYMSNGMNVVSLLLPCVLLIIAFFYPMFGKKNYYCNHVCPYGSLQELMGKTVHYKVKISGKTIRRLDTFRKVLWGALMVCLWTGLWFDWVNYEPFSAFMLESASWVVIAIALAFALLSAIVMRPYCRFVCPMGSMFKMVG